MTHKDCFDLLLCYCTTWPAQGEKKDAFTVCVHQMATCWAIPSRAHGRDGLRLQSFSDEECGVLTDWKVTCLYHTNFTSTLFLVCPHFQSCCCPLSPTHYFTPGLLGAGAVISRLQSQDHSSSLLRLQTSKTTKSVKPEEQSYCGSGFPRACCVFVNKADSCEIRWCLLRWWSWSFVSQIGSCSSWLWNGTGTAQVIRSSRKRKLKW